MPPNARYIIRAVDALGFGFTIKETADPAESYHLYSEIFESEEPLTIYHETWRGSKRQSFSFKHVNVYGIRQQTSTGISW